MPPVGAPDTDPGVALPPPPVGAPAPVSPAPSPAGAASHLREIGHTRALTTFCRTAIDHTNRSIVLLLENDERIGDVQNYLKTTDYDRSEISRNNGIRALVDRYVALRAAAVSGDGEMNALKEQLKDSPTDEQRAAMLQLQEALDGALMRQKRLADRIGRMIVILENHDRIDADTRSQEEFDALRAQNDFFAYKDPEGPLANLPSSLSETAKADAVDISDRAVDISHDEDDASNRLDAAFASCL